MCSVSLNNNIIINGIYIVSKMDYWIDQARSQDFSKAVKLGDHCSGNLGAACLQQFNK